MHYLGNIMNEPTLRKMVRKADDVKQVDANTKMKDQAGELRTFSTSFIVGISIR